MSGEIIIDLVSTTNLKYLNFNQFFFYDTSKHVVDPDSCTVSSKWSNITTIKYYNEAKYMSIGYPSTYISATADLNPCVKFKFSNLSKVASIVFYNRSDSNQDRILAYKMRRVYDGTINNSVVFSFTAELIQTFNTTTCLTVDAAGSGYYSTLVFYINFVFNKIRTLVQLIMSSTQTVRSIM